jgi:hypothetical protein
MYAAVASVSISTMGGCVIGITKPLDPLFPVSGDDPAFIAFNLGDYDKNFTFKRAGEQPNESTMISSSHWRLEDGCRLIDGEHRLFNAKAALTTALFDMRSVTKLIRHRIANYVVA